MRVCRCEWEVGYAPSDSPKLALLYGSLHYRSTWSPHASHTFPSITPLLVMPISGHALIQSREQHRKRFGAGNSPPETCGVSSKQTSLLRCAQSTLRHGLCASNEALHVDNGLTAPSNEWHASFISRPSSPRYVSRRSTLPLWRLSSPIFPTSPLSISFSVSCT